MANNSKINEKVEKVREFILEDHRGTIRQLSDMTGISYGVCQEILTQDLNIRCVEAKFVPRLLTTEQKQRRLDVCLELHEMADSDRSFISRIIRADESWIYAHDPETKQQSSHGKSPHSPRPRKARQV